MDNHLIKHNFLFFQQPLDVLLYILNPFMMDDLMFYFDSIIYNY